MPLVLPRAAFRQSAREESGLTLEDVAKRLPGKRWFLLRPEQKKNRISYLRRVELNGTPCEKLARRLGALYGCSCYLFLLDTPSGGVESQKATNTRRHRTRSVYASTAPTRTRRGQSETKRPEVTASGRDSFGA